MQFNDFNSAVEKQLEYTTKLLLKKGDEYAEDSRKDTKADRLAHFKKTAAILDVTQEQAIIQMMMKHIISIVDMVNSKSDYPMDKWEEKITDAINYLLILKAAVVERESQKVCAAPIEVKRKK